MSAMVISEVTSIPSDYVLRVWPPPHSRIPDFVVHCEEVRARMPTKVNQALKTKYYQLLDLKVKTTVNPFRLLEMRVSAPFETVPYSRQLSTLE